MRIGITCYPTYGGSGVVATELGASLASRGHEVHFISYAVPFRYDTDLQNTTFHEVQLSSYPLFKYPPYDLALACKMLEVIESHNLELLHVHYAIPHAISDQRHTRGESGPARSAQRRDSAVARGQPRPSR